MASRPVEGCDDWGSKKAQGGEINQHVAFMYLYVITLFKGREERVDPLVGVSRGGSRERICSKREEGWLSGC